MPDKYKQHHIIICDQTDKIGFIGLYRNPIFYIRMGREITKVHEIVSFGKSSWLKPYTDFNTNNRAKSKNNADIDFFNVIKMLSLVKQWTIC